MKPIKLFAITFVTALLVSSGVQGQMNENLIVVKNIYEVIHQKSTTSEEVKALTPNIQWEKLNNAKEVNERYNITFLAILKNEWRGISFQSLEFQETEKNKILVTGTVSGRKPTECEGVTTTFQHHWILKEGEIMNFNEY
ncbi:hypothetical protein [uncultured Planktosalinus sp.]|uniref:hypothetical protein n=1 Tax=uncultured Planktosalinus sp. TaxID=1810935 RepID=UPI0030DB38C7